jgi:protein TonB
MAVLFAELVERPQDAADPPRTRSIVAAALLHLAIIALILHGPFLLRDYPEPPPLTAEIVFEPPPPPSPAPEPPRPVAKPLPPPPPPQQQIEARESGPGEGPPKAEAPEPTAQAEPEPKPQTQPDPQPDPSPAEVAKVEPEPMPEPTPSAAPEPVTAPPEPAAAPPKPALAAPSEKPPEPTEPPQPAAPQETIAETPVLPRPKPTPPERVARVTPPRPSTTMHHPRDSDSTEPTGDRYLNALQALVDRQRTYPAVARPLGLRGTTVYELVIDRRGRLLNLRILKSSGIEILDRTGLEMIRAAAPFPAVPADFAPGLDPIPLTAAIEIHPT